jgi:hypothetical protein
MKTLHETEKIERYLFGKLSPSARLVFEARMLIDAVLKQQVETQRRLYAIVRHHGRRVMKSEVTRIHYQLFNDPAKEDFQSRIFELFTKK